MQRLRHPEELSEVEIRQEARFVLWALRCCALDHQRANPDVHGDIARGFELADALETLPSFRAFALHLQAAAPGVVWHGPACGCVSSSEMHVLHALAQVADHLRAATAAPADWWRILLPAAQRGQVDGWARHWLAELNRAGIEYPGTTRLIEALTPLQMLAEETPRRAAYMN